MHKGIDMKKNEKIEAKKTINFSMMNNSSRGELIKG